MWPQFFETARRDEPSRGRRHRDAPFKASTATTASRAATNKRPAENSGGLVRLWRSTIASGPGGPNHCISNGGLTRSSVLHAVLPESAKGCVHCPVPARGPTRQSRTPPTAGSAEPSRNTSIQGSPTESPAAATRATMPRPGTASRRASRASMPGSVDDGLTTTRSNTPASYRAVPSAADSSVTRWPRSPAVASRARDFLTASPSPPANPTAWSAVRRATAAARSTASAPKTAA